MDNKKCCILLSGEWRTNSTSIKKNFVKHPEINERLLEIIKKLESYNISIDIFIVTDDLHIQNTLDTFGNRIKNIYLMDTKYILNPSKVSFYVKKPSPSVENYIDKYLICRKNSYLSNTDPIIKEIPYDNFKKHPNAIRQFYKLNLCYKLAQSYGEYDMMMRYRPDVIIDCNINDAFIERIKNNIIINNDMFFCGTKKLMERICNIIEVYGAFYYYHIEKKEESLTRWMTAPETQVCYIYQDLYEDPEWVKINNSFNVNRRLVRSDEII